MKNGPISRREVLKRMGGFFALTAMASYTGLAATSCKSTFKADYIFAVGTYGANYISKPIIRYNNPFSKMITTFLYNNQI